MEINRIWFDHESIFIQTSKGEVASHPLAWFPRLLNATKEQKENYTLSPMGIHWEEIDEDLSFEGFFNYNNENEELQHI